MPNVNTFYFYLFNFRRVEYSEIQPPLAKKCECPCYYPRKDTVSADDVKDQNWSRIGPMGPLLDPKLYPVKVGKSPESAIMRSEQPDRFMIKVNNKKCRYNDAISDLWYTL